MFDCLRTTDDGGIEHLFVFDLPCDFVSLSDQAIDGGAGRPPRLFAQFSIGIVLLGYCQRGSLRLSQSANSPADGDPACVPAGRVSLGEVFLTVSPRFSRNDPRAAH